jgi:hypothetical protein
MNNLALKAGVPLPENMDIRFMQLATTVLPPKPLDHAQNVNPVSSGA